MSDSQGSFVWYELMTTDMKAAGDFYKSVVGWSTPSLADARHGLHALHERRVHGRRPDEPARGVPEDGSAAELDGLRRRRRCRRGDRQGEAARWDGLRRAARHPEHGPLLGRRRSAEGGLRHVPSRAGARPASGALRRRGRPATIGWHELYATDWEKALVFYSDMFGWKKDQAVDIGPMGRPTSSSRPRAADRRSAACQQAQGVPVNFWLYYFNVEAIDAGAERVKSATAARSS